MRHEDNDERTLIEEQVVGIQGHRGEDDGQEHATTDGDEDENEKMKQSTEIFLRSHWNSVMNNRTDEEDAPAGSLSSSSQWFERVLAHYAEPHRHYHTAEHLKRMFKLFDVYHKQLAHPKVVAMAIFFHDVIYDPRSKDNEAQSVREFESFVQETAGVSSFLSEKETELVKIFIMATVKHENSLVRTKVGEEQENEDDRIVRDLSFFLDFDLEILSADLEIYREYAAQIRQEYRHYSDQEFARGRIQVLQNFLEKRRSLFFTEPFRNSGASLLHLQAWSESRRKGVEATATTSCEERARDNLQTEIEELQNRLSDCLASDDKSRQGK